MINYPSKDSYICSDIFFQLQKVDTKCSRKKITDCRSKNNTMVLFFLHFFVGHFHDLFFFFLISVIVFSQNYYAKKFFSKEALILLIILKSTEKIWRSEHCFD